MAPRAGAMPVQELSEEGEAGVAQDSPSLKKLWPFQFFDGKQVATFRRAKLYGSRLTGMLDSTEMLSELRLELRSRFLEREASVRDEILAQCGAHVQGEAQAAQAAERATHELDFAVQQMSQTLENTQKEAARLRGQHDLLIRASGAAALASAASLAAARTEMDSLRAEVEEYKFLTQALTQEL